MTRPARPGAADGIRRLIPSRRGYDSAGFEVTMLIKAIGDLDREGLHVPAPARRRAGVLWALPRDRLSSSASRVVRAAWPGH
ncbi:hypothetical protein ACGFY9_16895 [Streptomyces sp. NPDC048504]|uniref:hypothetical protein n=1 Tax=Streptomyces sp. NPDC048504 TaxID=3365559 RepID=UPI00371B52EC